MEIDREDAGRYTKHGLILTMENLREPLNDPKLNHKQRKSLKHYKNLH